MEFYEFYTSFDINRRNGVENVHTNYYRERERRIADASSLPPIQKEVELARGAAELTWLRVGKPFFNLWPDMIPLLAGAGLDLPWSYLRFPYPAFVIRFPKTVKQVMATDEHHVQSILVLEGQTREGSRIAMLWIDIGEHLADGTPSLHWLRLLGAPDQTVAQLIAGERTTGLPGAEVSDAAQQDCLKIAICIGFLSTNGDKLVEPYILSKNISDYIDAKRRNDHVRMRVITERARRRGKLGYNVGQHFHLRPIINPSRETGDYAGQHHELHFQHLRRAHFRALADDNVVFVRPTVVRPDLPPSGNAPGYEVRT